MFSDSSLAPRLGIGTASARSPPLETTMDQEKALGILQSLSNGIDPITGEVFPAHSPYQHPDIVRALFLGVRAMEGAVAAQKRQAARPSGGNAGKPWAKDEDERLLAGFDRGQSIDDLAAAHARSRLAIEARLARFGRMPVPAGVRVVGAQSAREPEGRYAARM
jgi:hypothetical protein